MLDINKQMKRIIVVGGGASGLFASYSASLNKKNEVILIEKNEKLGKKIYITGKGRCNLSNFVDLEDFLSNVIRNQKFLYSSIGSFSPYDTYSFFEENGLKLKIERGNRVFPESDKASDVTKTLEKLLKDNKVEVKLNTEFYDLIIENDIVKGVKTSAGNILGDSVILCTGGFSYPLTGSTGDGVFIAEKYGHKLVDIKPSLVGLNTVDTDIFSLQGLSLKNVSLSAFYNDKKVFSDFGEMLFTHFGVSGPIILSCSCNINRLDINKVKLVIDLKPALDYTVLDNRIIREMYGNGNKSISNIVRTLVPQNLVEIILKRSGVALNKKCCEITKHEREKIGFTLKNLTLKIKSLRPIDEAIVSSGGVSIEDINARTMESKKIKNLFFAGEMIDVDAYTGGFNLQIAFSTGYKAGLNA